MTASERDLAERRFLTTPATFKSSITRTWHLSTKALKVRWTKCRRVLATFRGEARASRARARWRPATRVTLLRRVSAGVAIAHWRWST